MNIILDISIIFTQQPLFKPKRNFCGINMNKRNYNLNYLKDSKKIAKKNYDRLSRWYDLLAEHDEGVLREKGLEILGAVSGETILELGFGTGHGILDLAKAVDSSGKVYGIDISEGMYDVAMDRLSKAGFKNRVELTLGDAERLPYSDQFFDAIFMSFTLELFDENDIPIVLNECKRVLKDDGRMSVVALLRKKETNLMVKMYEWAHEKFPEIIDCKPIFVLEFLKAAGFKIQKSIEMSMWGLPVEIVLVKKSLI